LFILLCPSSWTRPKRKLHFGQSLMCQEKSMYFQVHAAKNDLLIVTTYDQLQSSKQICFIGTASNKPTPKTWALLCLVHQQTDFKSSFDTNSYVVHDSKSDCKRAKHNIVTGRATGHHRSCGNIHGFGSCRDMHINNKTLSSLSNML